MPKGFTSPENMPEGFSPDNAPQNFTPREMPSGEKFQNRVGFKVGERQSGDEFSRRSGNYSDRKTKKDSITSSTEASI